jgi:hypothetical protein
VAGAGGAERNQDIAPHQAGGLFKFFDGKIAHNSFGKGVYHRHGKFLSNQRLEISN